jgi:hypothetical protein
MERKSSMVATTTNKCRQHLDDLCFHIKDKLEFAENGKYPLSQCRHMFSVPVMRFK